MNEFEKETLKEITKDLTPEQIESIRNMRFDEAYVKVGIFEANFDSGNPILDGIFVLIAILLIALVFKVIHKEIKSFFKEPVKTKPKKKKR